MSPKLRLAVSASAGITRERLESFDRPIKVEPEDYPDKRGALIGEFQNYLGILKVRRPHHIADSSDRLIRPQDKLCAAAVWVCVS